MEDLTSQKVREIAPIDEVLDLHCCSDEYEESDEEDYSSETSCHSNESSHIDRL